MGTATIKPDDNGELGRVTKVAEQVALARAAIGRVLHVPYKEMSRLFKRSPQKAPINVGVDSPLQRKANAIAKTGAFLGGPAAQYHAIGCNQLVTLLELGLMPHHRVLDIGCGCLRGGYWLIHFLDRERYFGIEPNIAMLELGLREFIPPQTLADKAPHFDHNSDFDFSVFSNKFDYMIARSIWSHAAPAQIEKMLDQFVAWSTPEAVFLTSVVKAKLGQRQYDGEAWVGRSHASGEVGVVRYRLEWIKEQCRRRGLRALELRRNILDQVWLEIGRTK